MSALLRKGTWVAIAAGVFAGGAALVHMLAVEPRIAVANPPTHEVISRAIDSEMEVSPSLAAQKDGSLAVAWIAQTGGREGAGRYVGVRVSEPGAGKLGALFRVSGPSGEVSHATVVPYGGEFALVFASGDSVYSAHVSRGGVSAPELVAAGKAPRAAASGANLYVALSDAKGIALATSRDGKTFAKKDLGGEADSHAGTFLGVCGDEHTAIVVASGDKRVSSWAVPVDPEGPPSNSDVSAIGEHLARTSPACFVTGEDAFVVYALTDKPQDQTENAITDALVFVHSRDGGKNFLMRVPHRPSSRVYAPTLSRGQGTFTLLGVMGSGANDAHASASVIVLGTDGRSQNGLTRTVIAPVTMATSPDAAGFMGDSFGLADVGGATWTAVVDNASGESHVALASVL
jgi:hypothetical protein